MTEPTPDSPPRPQYGEYATPEEQRARIRQPGATADLDAGSAPGPQVARPVVAPAPMPRAGADGVPRGKAIDRIVTFALLAFGLIFVLSSILSFLDYGSLADTFADNLSQRLGVDVQLSDPEAVRPWGLAAALVLGVGWVLTAAASWRRIRRGRPAWWIPVVGGLVFPLASYLLVVVPLMSDPAVWTAIQGTIG